MISSLINKYQLSKTLRFSLIPIGKTEEYFNVKIFEEDLQRSEDYPIMKELMDKYHKKYIEDILSNITKEDIPIGDYAVLFYKKSKTGGDIKRMREAEDELRKFIAYRLQGEMPAWNNGKVEKNDKEKKGSDSEKSGNDKSIYKKLFEKEMIKDLIKKDVSEEKGVNGENLKKNLEVIKRFEQFTTYFTGFHKNRENMYSEKDQTTAISHRCINDNLPRFLGNSRVFMEKISGRLTEDISVLNDDISGFGNESVDDMFSLDYFAHTLPQSGIDDYNRMLGGYSNSDGSKIKGLNEYINLYNQKAPKSERIPQLKPLYKQILSDRETVSFIPDTFEDDSDLLKAINDYYNETGANIKECIEKCCSLISRLDDFNCSGIFVNAKAISDLSQKVFQSWSFIQEKWNEQYDFEHMKKKNSDNYYDKRRKEYKKIKVFSLENLKSLTDDAWRISDYLKSEADKLRSDVDSCYADVEPLLTGSYKSEKKLSQNDEAIEKIKNFMDSVKEVERFLRNFYGWKAGENESDENFYGALVPYMDIFDQTRHFYDQVRNYLTAKPYSKDKIKLNFKNPQLLGGWDKNKEKDCFGVILRKDGNYYLGLLDKDSDKKIFEDDSLPTISNEDDYYEKMEYKLLPGPNKMLPKVFFSKKEIEFYAPSEKILNIRKNESFKKGANFKLNDCHAFIDFYKYSIKKHPDWSKFDFCFSNTNDYEDISGFYREVEKQGYKLSFTKVSKNYIDLAVEKGKLYLFQIYNKDFSPYSKGKPNLHTLYFKMLFDERNLSKTVLKLNGKAEMFYRPASMNGEVTHKANEKIANKNPDNPKRESVFDYDLIKDRRFTKRQFALHVPITLNFSSDGEEKLNDLVRTKLRNQKHQHVIGIDRGERNLIYICVIDETGEIIEQKSLNEIINTYNGVKYMVDYHKLLDEKEKARDKARKSWTTIENIKELKEGYISQVVNEICSLVKKYDAIIAMEELNDGFKRGRFKVEKQVYQKFENALISKLQYLADKTVDPETEGGLLNAYQLVNKESKDKFQNGIVFYIPAWLTSKIDPTTGFANLLRPKYTSLDAAKGFFEAFDDIRYDKDKDLFAFEVNYTKFPDTTADYRKKWTIYSYGNRIKTFRNPDKNNEWDYMEVVLTNEFKALFNEMNIDINRNLKNQILNVDKKEHIEELLRLLSLTLQMRNSITNSDTDYLISPVMNTSGEFYDSRIADKSLPQNADANGAYNIARKALWAVKQICEASQEDYQKTKIAISNKEWLEFAQENAYSG